MNFCVTIHSSAANPGNIKLAKKLDFSLKTFGFSLKHFRRSLNSWRGRGGAPLVMEKVLLVLLSPRETHNNHRTEWRISKAKPRRPATIVTSLRYRQDCVSHFSAVLRRREASLHQAAECRRGVHRGAAGQNFDLSCGVSSRGPPWDAPIQQVLLETPSLSREPSISALPHT